MLINELRYTLLPTAPASPPAQAAPAAEPSGARTPDPVDRVNISDAAKLTLSSATAIDTSVNAPAKAEQGCKDCAAGICTSCGDKSSNEQDELSEEEQAQVRELKKRDEEVRAHEAAHAATGGAFAGSPSYEYQTGPDGKRYAIGGEVKIDTSPIDGDPGATINKMRQVQAAALAPAEPSGQDKKVAAAAAAKIREAEAELAAERAEEFKAKTSGEDKEIAAPGETVKTASAPLSSEDRVEKQDTDDQYPNREQDDLLSRQIAQAAQAYEKIASFA